MSWNLDGSLGLITISFLCEKDNPCRHHLVVNRKEYDYNGVEIYDFLLKNKYRIPQHFVECRNLINKVKPDKSNIKHKCIII